MRQTPHEGHMKATNVAVSCYSSHSYTPKIRAAQTYELKSRHPIRPNPR